MGRLLSDLSHQLHLKAREDVTGAKGTPKILIHSTHDTALAGLASTLDVFDDRWPAFTASMTFELFRRVAEPNAREAAAEVSGVEQAQNAGVFQAVLGSSPFRRKARTASDYCTHHALVRVLILSVIRSTPADVRARYQNRNLFLPVCADEGKHLPEHPEFCTLKAFAERVAELTPRDWEAECTVE